METNLYTLADRWKKGNVVYQSVLGRTEKGAPIGKMKNKVYIGSTRKKRGNQERSFEKRCQVHQPKTGGQTIRERGGGHRLLSLRAVFLLMFGSNEDEKVAERKEVGKYSSVSHQPERGGRGYWVLY